MNKKVKFQDLSHLYKILIFCIFLLIHIKMPFPGDNDIFTIANLDNNQTYYLAGYDSIKYLNQDIPNALYLSTTPYYWKYNNEDGSIYTANPVAITRCVVSDTGEICYSEGSQTLFLENNTEGNDITQWQYNKSYWELITSSRRSCSSKLFCDHGVLWRKGVRFRC